jgi:hypothetical protein
MNKKDKIEARKATVVLLGCSQTRVVPCRHVSFSKKKKKFIFYKKIYFFVLT